MRNFSDEKVAIETVTQKVIHYLSQQFNKCTLAINYQPPKSLDHLFTMNTVEPGENIEAIYKEIDKYLTCCVNSGHPQFFNHLFSGFNYIGYLGEMITNFTNETMTTFESSPVATVMEVKLLKKMAKLIGFKEHDGIITSGGSQSNLVALLSARQYFFPEIKKEGYKHHQNLCILVSDQSHYSMQLAGNMIGIGLNNIIAIKTDANGRMLPNKLEEMILKLKAENLKPFFICAMAGTSVLGAFDPIDKIAEIAQHHNLWLHVDGCLGGSALLSKKFSHLLRGVKYANSIAWDCHKAMGIPLTCATLILRHPGLLKSTYSGTDTSYVFRTESDWGYPDLGQKSPQCSRRADALKLWLSWKFYGDAGYDRMITHLFDLAVYAEKKVRSNPMLELVTARTSWIVCFRVNDPQQADLNEYNKILRKRLYKSGKSLVNYAYINDHLVFRFVTVDPAINYADIDTFFENLEHIIKITKDT